MMGMPTWYWVLYFGLLAVAVLCMFPWSRK